MRREGVGNGGRGFVIEGISIRSTRSSLSHRCSGCDSHATAIHSLAVSARPCPFARDVCRETAPMPGQLCQTSNDIFSAYRVACPLPIAVRLVRAPWSRFRVARQHLHCHIWRGVFSSANLNVFWIIFLGVVKFALSQRVSVLGAW